MIMVHVIRKYVNKPCPRAKPHAYHLGVEDQDQRWYNSCARPAVFVQVFQHRRARLLWNRSRGWHVSEIMLSFPTVFVQVFQH